MRGLLLCCLVALATCENTSYEPGLNPRKTYEYKYEGEVRVGRDKPILAGSGVRMTCKAKITGVSAETFLLQVSDLTFEEFNGFPGKAAFKASPKLAQRMAAQLARPFMFEYARGRVGDIHAPAEASDTIVNIVRGILGFLQVTVKTTQRVYDLEEAGIHGLCQSSYAIDMAETKDMTITQVVDVDNCRQKAAMFKGMALAVADKLSKERGESVATAVRYIFTVKPTTDGGVITKAHALETQHFTPFSLKGGTSNIQAVKEMVLLSVTDTAGNPSTGPLVNKGSLVYKFPNDLTTIPIIMQNLDDPATKAVALIKCLARDNIYQVDSASSGDIIKVYQLLRLVPFEGLEDMWKQLAGNAEHRRWFLDMVVEVTDARVLKFLALRFKAGDVSANEAAQTFMMALQHLQPLPELVEMAKEFFIIPFSKSNPFLWRTVMLAYGSLVYRQCAYVTPCPVPAVQPLSDMAVDALNRRSEADMVLALKALGNAGHPGSIKTIMRFLPGVAATPVELPRRVLSAAVQAMRLIAARDPQRVQDIALNLFVQKALASEVRMLALMMLFDSKPPRALVSTLTAHLLDEKDYHVASFAFSLMKSFSRSSTPDNHFLSIVCNVAVKILAPKFGRLSYRFSKAKHLDWFSDDFLMGTATEVMMLRSAASFFPTEIMVKGKFHFIGRILQLLELGVRAEGIKELFGANIPGFKGDLSYSDFMAVVDVLKNWETLPQDKPVLSVYSRAFGQEWLYADMNRDLIQRVIGAVRPSAGKESAVWGMIESLRSGLAWHWTKPFLIFETRYIQATTLGLPVEISKYYGSVTAITVNAKAAINPPLSQRLGELLTSEVSLETDGFIGVTKDHWIFHGINTDLFQSAVELKSKAPIALPWKFAAKINVREKKFELDFPPCTREIEFFGLTFDMYAVSRNIEEPAAAKMTPMMPNANDANNEMVAPDTYHPIAKVCADSNVYGAAVCVESEMKRAYYNEEYPLYYFMGYTHLALKLTPAHAIKPVDKIHIEVNAGPSRHPATMGDLLETLRRLSKEATRLLPLNLGSSSGSQEEPQYVVGLATSATPEAVFNINALAVSGAATAEGYDAALYYTPEAQGENVQIILSQVGEAANWKMCTDANVVHGETKVHLRWGAECQPYELTLKAATAHLPGARPTIKTRIHWAKVPERMAEMGRSMETLYIPGLAFLLGFSQQHERNTKQEMSASVVVSTADSVDIRIKLPELTVSRQAVPIPFPVADFQELQFYARNTTWTSAGLA